MLKQLSLAAMLMTGLLLSACSRTPRPTTQPSAAAAKPAAPSAVNKYAWQSLFDGKTLGKWKVSDFAGHGEVHVEDGAIVIPMGNADMSGVTWTGTYPKMNYEISLEAKRVQGSDFFCALTFPVNDSNATLVLGGWGGSVCGISCLDYEDAARNDTTKTRQFKDGQWYRVRMRVTEDKLKAWLDDEPLVDVVYKGRKVDIRIECTESKPLGIATWNTTGAARDIRIRELRPDEIEEARREAKEQEL